MAHLKVFLPVPRTDGMYKPSQVEKMSEQERSMVLILTVHCSGIKYVVPQGVSDILDEAARVNNRRRAKQAH